MTFAAASLTRRQWLAGIGALGASGAFANTAAAPVPVLVYHRFGAEAVDSMTVRLATFRAHLDVLRSLDCRVVPMQDFLDWQAGRRELPPRAVVLTADDAHRSQFEHMAPLLEPLGWEVTVFVYPSAVSNASYAMTWEQLRALQATGRYRIESHTFWHPNFAQERRRLAPDAFERLAREQMVRSRERLQRELGRPVRLLAWPFGVADEGLQGLAREVGYEAAFSLGNRRAGRNADRFAVPRYLVTEAMGPAQLRAVLAAALG
jgi:peptidoglycan/xylan/chitin deacetylase (PgdA/CDA1 family)